MLPTHLQQVIAQRPLGLVFDIDGTISPIAPTPGEARLYPGIAQQLAAANEHAGVYVAINTGRAADIGAAMVNVEGLTYMGVYGLEWLKGPLTRPIVELLPEARIYSESAKQLLDMAEAGLADIPEILIERKRTGGAIHFRLAPDHHVAHERILALLAEPTRQRGMRLIDGKLMLELVPPLEMNKGKALRRLVQHFELRGIMFAGDDVSDLDAVREIRQMKEEGIAAISVAVKHHDSPPALLREADIAVEQVDGMAELLGEIVAAL